MQWLTSMLYMVCPDHYFFDPAYSRLNKAENKKDPLAMPDDKFTHYKDAFLGMNVPKPKKRAYVSNALSRPVKPTKVQQMQNEINRLAKIIIDVPNV